MKGVPCIIMLAIPCEEAGIGSNYQGSTFIETEAPWKVQEGAED
jgi:hypothetical protein